MEETAGLSAIFVKKEEDAIKREGDIDDGNFGQSPLWKGNVLLQQGKSKSLRVACKIFHQDDSKGSPQLFDWTHGVSSVTIQKYPMTVLGGKSKPSMKNLKPFIKDSHIVRLVCDESKQQEELIKELERGEDGQQFFLADPGSSIPLVIVSVDKNLFGSCVSLKSKKEQLASYEEFREHLSSNIIQHSWSKDLEVNVNKLAEDETAMCALDTAFDIRIENSWSENSQAMQSDDDRPLSGRLSGSPQNENLKSHIRQHTGEKSNMCTICEISVPGSQQHLNRHIMTHTGERPFKCTQCDYTCKRSHHLKRHKLSHHTVGRPFPCTYCESSFSTGPALTRHMRQHTGETSYTCTYCESLFTNSRDLKRHTMTHTGVGLFSCTKCSYTCIRSHQLKSHMRQHLRDEPFSDTQSENSQAMQSDDERPLPGSQGDLDSQILVRHLRSDSLDKPFSCTQCSYSSSRKKNLMNHMRQHTGDKPYTCTHCGKSFPISQSLKRHIMTHTGERPFSCTHCDYTCNQSAHLKKHHMRQHTDVRPFPCTV